MDNPLVSIILTTYNGERWLDAAVQSVLDQTYPSLKALYFIGPVPGAGVSLFMFQRRVARLHYCLARLERSQGSFKEALCHFWKAIRLYPAVGLLFHEQVTNSLDAIRQVVKPYGALLHSALMTGATEILVNKDSRNAHRN